VLGFEKRPARNRSPIKLIKMKVTTKANRISSAGVKADSEQNVENLFVSQHSRKPLVVGSQSHGTLKYSLSPLDDFQKQIIPIKKSLSNILNSFSVKSGFEMKVINGKLLTYIDVEAFRKD
jgi:hypothetical protein